MSNGVLIHPVFLFPGHTLATGNLAGGSGLVQPAGQRPVAERLWVRLFCDDLAVG